MGSPPLFNSNLMSEKVMHKHGTEPGSPGPNTNAPPTKTPPFSEDYAYSGSHSLLDAQVIS